MAQPTLAVKDASGTTVTVFTQNPNGQSTGANSQPVVLASDQGLFQIENSTFYNESVTPLGASATFTGPGRDIGAVSGALCSNSYFQAFVLTNQAGVIRIESSPDNVTWSRVTVDTAIVANTPLFLKVASMTRYHRVVVVNGGTLQTSLVINSSYTGS